MSKPIHTAQQYWDVRSDLFANYYNTLSITVLQILANGFWKRNSLVRMPLFGRKLL